MAYSSEKCTALAAKIKLFEDGLDKLALGGQAVSIQDGPEAVRFTSANRALLQNRLDSYKRDYASGGCAVVLGNDDVTPIRRRALRPVIGHR